MTSGLLGRRDITILKNQVVIDNLYIGEGLIISTNLISGTTIYSEITLEKILCFQEAISPVFRDHGRYFFQDNKYNVYSYESQNNEMLRNDIVVNKYLVNGIKSDHGVVTVEYKAIEDSPLERTISLYNNKFEIKWTISNPLRSFVHYGSTYSNKYYFVDHKSNLRALLLEDGSEAWSINNKEWPMTKKAETTSPPIVFNDTLVLFNFHCIFGLEAGTGKIKWQYEVDFARAVLSADGRLYFATYRKPYHLICLDSSTGKVISDKPILFDDELLDRLPNSCGAVYKLYQGSLWICWSTILAAVDIQTGTAFYWYELDYPIMGPLTISNNRIYLSTLKQDISDFQVSYYIFEGEGGYIPD